MALKKMFFKDENLVLICEWNECCEVFSQIDPFLSHIESHVNESTPEDLSCYWLDCDYNNTQFDDITALMRHVLFHGFHCKLKCYGHNLLDRSSELNQCIFESSSRNMVPVFTQEFRCYWKDCEQKFENAEMFYRHVNHHVLEYKDIKRVGCLNCHWRECKIKSLSQLEKLRSHLRTHTQEKLIACPTCGNLFVNRTKFVDHIKRQLASDKAEFQCSCCDKLFGSERILKNHMENHVYKLKCTKCDYIAQKKSALVRHMKYRHDGQRDLKCSSCDYRAKTIHCLKRHQETHSPAYTMVCPEEDCYSKFKNYNLLMQHYKTSHMGKRKLGYACHLCEKIYSRGQFLSQHLIKKHDVEVPSGQSRFRYKECDDGLCRMLLVEYRLKSPTEVIQKKNADGTTRRQLNSETITSDSTASQIEPSISNEKKIYVEIKQPDGSSNLCEWPVVNSIDLNQDLTISVIAEQPEMDST